MVEVHPVEASVRICERGLGRLSLDVPAKLVLIDGEVRCTLVDLSLNGAKVSFGGKADPGEAALLKMDGFEAFGEVIWSRHGLIGIRFDERITKDFLLRAKALSADYDRYVSRLAAREWVSGSH